jgi:hypothetical protein
VEIPVEAIQEIAAAAPALTGTSAKLCTVGATVKFVCAYRARNNAIAWRDTASVGLNNGFPDACGVPVEIPFDAIHSIAL